MEVVDFFLPVTMSSFFFFQRRVQLDQFGFDVFAQFTSLARRSCNIVGGAIDCVSCVVMFFGCIVATMHIVHEILCVYFVLPWRSRVQ